ncbi:hypothetical protein IU453_26870 [Nocardia cyriacigeorgica]|uniref:hypothetical protein n=1 Tax=Nocardia cyriacigeorgica TaxID=135487 RepID=UPI0018935D2F|nr:hypothetical protein [Nocardia cyriacigeorgica]MBF6320378.1 hypothetical protein [Nocardia cyriacigeorgica]MBF6534136.1 hypothetical protein [Nocardia cyriacigeorgica]
MSAHRRGPRLRDLPTAQTNALRALYDHTVTATRLRTTTPTRAVDVPPQLEAAEREQALAEIAARSTGLPDIWVEHIRRLAATGAPWHPGHQLPPAPARRPQRRTRARVNHDLTRLREMAALAAVREHRHPATQAIVEATTVDGEQLRRNMSAVRTRALATAAAIRLDREHLTISDTQLAHTCNRLLAASVTDLDALWHTHTRDTIAADVRNSLRSLRRHHPNLRLDDSAIDRPSQLIARAHTLLVASGADRDGQVMENAITAAIGTVEAPSTEPGPDLVTAPAEETPHAVTSADHHHGPTP